MKHSMRPLYPTPLFVGQVEDIAPCLAEVDSILPTIDWKIKPEWGTTHKLSTNSFEEDALTEYNLIKVDSQIRAAVALYCQDLGFEMPETYSRRSWITRYDRGEYAQIHNHGYSDISGVYYHSVGSKAGNIFFENPNLAAHGWWVMPPDRVEYVPKPGMIILFPGYLYHGVQTNDSDDTRVSISFNCVFERY